jgi:hypothetical protein
MMTTLTPPAPLIHSPSPLLVWSTFAIIAGPIVVSHTISEAGIGLSVAHNDDVDTTSTGGSLATTAPDAVHLNIVSGPIEVKLVVAPQWERVSCIVVVSLVIH